MRAFRIVAFPSSDVIMGITVEIAMLRCASTIFAAASAATTDSVSDHPKISSPIPFGINSPLILVDVGSWL